MPTSIIVRTSDQAEATDGDILALVSAVRAAHLRADEARQARRLASDSFREAEQAFYAAEQERTKALDALLSATLGPIRPDRD